MREASLAESPQVQLEIDRRQANALGVSFADIGSVLDVAVGSSYVNDFPNQGRMQRVVVQAEGDQRSQVEDLLKIHVRTQQRQDGATGGIRPGQVGQRPGAVDPLQWLPGGVDFR